MGAKSSGGIIGTLLVVAVVGYVKFNNWQRNERRKEIVRNAEEMLRTFNTSSDNQSLSSNLIAVEKAHMDSVMTAGKRGDLVGRGGV